MSLGSTAVRSFTDLAWVMAERMKEGGCDLEEDITSFLEVKRRYWTATWEETLVGDEPWKEWSEAEPSVEHPDAKVAHWVAHFAKLANLSGPDAQKVALLWSTDYILHIVRSPTSLQVGGSPVNAQVLKYYFLERRSFMFCRCLLLEALSNNHSPRNIEIKNKLSKLRPKIIKQIIDRSTSRIEGLKGQRNVDGFFAERELQYCAEDTVMFQFLLCLNKYCSTPSSSDVVTELNELINSPAAVLFSSPGSYTVNCVLSLAKFRTMFTALLLQSILIISKNNQQTSIQSVLGTDVLRFITSLEGPEGSLAQLVILCIDRSPPTYQMLLNGLNHLQYIVTGVYRPPPGSSEGASDLLPDLDLKTFSFLKEPLRELAEEILTVVTATCQPRKQPETVVSCMVRAAISAQDWSGTGFDKKPDDPSGSGLIQELSRAAGWLFPSCISATALIEAVAASPSEHHEYWWLCLRGLDKTAISYPFEQPQSIGDLGPDNHQRVLADLPEDSSLYEIKFLQASADIPRVVIPSAFGNWLAPLAPIPGQKATVEAERLIRSRVERPEDVLSKNQIFAVWQLPPDKGINGWMWMCMRVLHLLKLRGAEPSSEKWLVPYLELVNGIIPLFHVMICGKDPDNELSYFTKEGGLVRLQEIEQYLQELQRELVGGVESWSLALMTGELLANLVEWQEAKCYSQRALLIKSCSSLLKSLLRLSRKIQQIPSFSVTFNVAEAIVSSLRCLLQPGRQTSRSPLLHLFWVVEAANKRCSCTYGVVSLVKELLSCSDDYVYLRGDFKDVTAYACEVFADLSNQWYHNAEEQWELTYCCLHTIVDIIRLTRLESSCDKTYKQNPLMANLLHHSRMGRALADMLGRVSSSIFDVDRYDKGVSIDQSNKVLQLVLKTIEYGLEACEEIRRSSSQYQPPVLVQFLCETESGISLRCGDKFSIPALLFHIAAFGPDDLIKIQACRTFSLLCSTAPTGSLLRHVGYRASTSGQRILKELDPSAPAGAWTRPVLEFEDGEQIDPEMNHAFNHGLRHPGISDASMPTIFRSRKDVHLIWLEASRNTYRFLCLIRMMTSIVKNQPQLFAQAFLNQGFTADPLGSLLRNYVVVKDDPEQDDPRTDVKEAIVQLTVAALETKESCRSVILSRTIPTLTIRITAQAYGLGDRLSSEDGRGCPWYSMPKIRPSDLAPLREIKFIKDSPCLLFDRTRSWTNCGFLRRDADLVDAPMSLVLGPLSAMPDDEEKAQILKAAEEIAKKSFESAGISDVNVIATFYGRPVKDPEVWQILTEVLYDARSQIGQWMTDGNSTAKPGQASSMSLWILIAGHVLRAMAVVSSLDLIYPQVKTPIPDQNMDTEDYETSILVSAARHCLEEVFGKWGDTSTESETSGVLGMLVPSVEGFDGLLGQAAGLFYGSVAVPTLRHPRVTETPMTTRRLPSLGLNISGTSVPTTSPRKTVFSDDSPKMVSPLIRPAFAQTPGSMESLGGSMFVNQFPNTPPLDSLIEDDEIGLDSSSSPHNIRKLTLYEMLKTSEAELIAVLRDSGVAMEICNTFGKGGAAQMDNCGAISLTMLRGRLISEIRAADDGIPAAAASKMPGAFIDMEPLRTLYPRMTYLLSCVQEVNHVVGLAAASFYMLSSVSQFISILLQRVCPYSTRTPRAKLIPTKALLNSGDWRQGPKKSLVFVLLQRCLLHPAHESGTFGQDGGEGIPSPLVSLLDSHIRAEACRLLSEMITEISDRVGLVRQGRLDSADNIYANAQDKHTVQRQIVWDIFSVLRTMRCAPHQGSGTDTQPRVGKSKPGEPDLLLSLCLLGNPSDWSTYGFKSEIDANSAAIASALFPHLHQYLAIDDLSSAGSSDVDCYKAAFIALCTFGVPKGCVRHAIQVSRTLLNHLRVLHSNLQHEMNKQQVTTQLRSGMTPLSVQDIIDRSLLILKGLRSMAASPCGAEVFAAAEVLPFLLNLKLFMPPTPSSVVPSEESKKNCHGVGFAPLNTFDSSIACDRGTHPWHILWQAIIDTASAAAIPPPVDGVRHQCCAQFCQHVQHFADHLKERVQWLLSQEGLHPRNVSDEPVRCLQLISCLTRSKLSALNAVTVANPVLPWVLPCLHKSLDILKRYILGELRSHTAVDHSSPLLLTQVKVGQSTHQGTGSTSTQQPVVDYKKLCIYFDIASQVASIMRLHLISLLPVAAPVGSLGGASRAVRNLLVTLELAAESRSQKSIDYVNRSCKEALSTPETCVKKVLEAHGYPFKMAPSGSELRRLREAILAECASSWTPSAGISSREILTYSSPSVHQPASFTDVAVFGTDDDLTQPAKSIIGLTEAISERVASLLNKDDDTTTLPNGPGKKRKKETRIGSAVKAAACAIEQAAVLRQVYTMCLELASPTEPQSLWAGNVLQRVLKEKSALHLTNVPGSVLKKRLVPHMAELSQTGKTEEIERIQLALAYHCIEESRRQPPDTLPWLARPCLILHKASEQLASRNDPAQLVCCCYCVLWEGCAF
eukprot:TRINITY_DN1892_c3_g1_i1.p1 TRINITY_DN1892_c3_g1~~TRINITY_DN1892_c3_g1_i1.p1  ORF type:complete len:2491 (+),score=394.95 TRINITY_DN1892_c3_g1_i1:41-7513(+)